MFRYELAPSISKLKYYFWK